MLPHPHPHLPPLRADPCWHADCKAAPLLKNQDKDRPPCSPALLLSCSPALLLTTLTLKQPNVQRKAIAPAPAPAPAPSWSLHHLLQDQTGKPSQTSQTRQGSPSKYMGNLLPQLLPSTRPIPVRPISNFTAFLPLSSIECS